MESPTPSPQLSDLETPILRALEDVLCPWTFDGSEPAVVRLLAAIRAARDEKCAAHAALVEALKLALEMAETYYGYYESEFRVSSDSPDLEYHAKLAQIAAALALAEPKQ